MRIRRCINIEKTMWEKLDKLAKGQGRSKSNMIEYLIMLFSDFDNNKK